LRKPKKPARRREPPSWEALRLKASPAASIGIVHADDAESAIAAAIKECDIRHADQKRLIARPR
jgi:hypothetical protein